MVTVQLLAPSRAGALRDVGQWLSCQFPRQCVLGRCQPCPGRAAASSPVPGQSGRVSPAVLLSGAAEGDGSLSCSAQGVSLGFLTDLDTACALLPLRTR